MSLPVQERRGVSAVARPGFARDTRIEPPNALTAIKQEAAFGWLCCQLLSGMSSIRVLPGEVGTERDWVRPAIQSNVDPRDAVAAHLLAGDRRNSVSLPGYTREPVRAVAFAYSKRARTSRLTIHLSGRVPGYDVGTFVQRLGDRVGHSRLLVTSVSAMVGGRREHRCHVRVPEMEVLCAVTAVAQLLEDCGFAQRSGVVEVFPDSRFAGLPFGLLENELLRYGDGGLESEPECGWRRLVAEFQALETLDIERRLLLSPSDPEVITPRAEPPAPAAVPPRAADPPIASTALPVVSGTVEAYFDLVCHGVNLVSVQPESCPWTPEEGWKWTKTRIDVKRSVVAHLLASQTGQPSRLGRRGIRAAGLSYRPDATTSRITIDLDGKHGYEPAKVVAALAAIVGRDRLMVTSSSGSPGHYHCHARVSPMRMDEAVAASRVLLDRAGFKWKLGGAETYPSTGNCRLPFGLGGCELFEDEQLQVGHQETWQELTKRLCGMPTLVFQSGSPPGSRARRHVRSRARARNAETAARIERWRANGVERHERNQALFDLVVDGRCRGLTEDEVIRELQGWIDGGGLARSAVARKPGGIAKQRNQVLPDVVERVYGYPPPAKQKANLTDTEIAWVVEIAKERCPKRRAHAVVLLLDVLPWFKAAWLEGRTDVTLGQKEWARTLGRRGDGYALLRRQLHLFKQTSHYVIGERSTTWCLTEPVPFESRQPTERLVSTNPRPATKRTGSKPSRLQKTAWVLAAAERVARGVVRDG